MVYYKDKNYHYLQFVTDKEWTSTDITR